MKVLVTGGAGYIGSHFVKQLLKSGFEAVVLDNLSRGHKESVPENVVLEEVDLKDFNSTSGILRKYSFDAVVHFAAYAYVGESVENPELYYTNNVVGTMNLLKAVKETGIKKFVFSSTCSLYGNPLTVPISEEESVKPINPYAQTKNIIENVLKDYSNSYGINYVALRYFNAAGADPEGEIGESHDPEPHLIPITLEAAQGKREKVYVFGNDYETPDGTCLRDYIHINDLADAHVKALEYLNEGNESDIFNLGTGDGNSVLEIINTAVRVTGKKIEYEIAGRREGDPAVLVADNKKAKKILGWSPQYNLEDIISTAWNWHSNQKF